MSALLARPRTAATLFVVGFIMSSAPRAEAQYGFGDPLWLFGMPQVPSPTDFLQDKALRRVSAYSNVPRQTASQSLRDSPNAYWNRLRDVSGETSYDISSRRSLSQRMSSPARATPTPATAASAVPARPDVQSIENYFLDDGRVDWPRDAPDDGPLRTDRAAADDALRAVRDQIRGGGHASAQSVAAARAKLVAYGQQALARVRSERSPAVAVVFHYHLLFLNDTLGALGD